MIKKFKELLIAAEYSMPLGTLSTIFMTAFSEKVRTMPILPFIINIIIAWIGFSLIWAFILIQIDKYIKRK